MALFCSVLLARELTGEASFPCQQEPLHVGAATAAKGERGADPAEHGTSSREGRGGEPPLRVDIAVVVETYSGQLPNTPDQTPDADLAVSPDHVVVISNFTILVMRRSDPSTAVNRWLMGYHSGSPTIPQLWDAALGVTNHFVVDPEVYWDDVSGRFFLVASVGTSPGPTEPPPQGNLLVAVSKTSDPRAASGTASDAWWQYYMNVPFQSSGPSDYVDNPAFAIRGSVMALGYDYAGSAHSRLLTLRTADFSAARSFSEGLVQRSRFPGRTTNPRPDRAPEGVRVRRHDLRPAVLRPSASMCVGQLVDGARVRQPARHPGRDPTLRARHTQDPIAGGYDVPVAREATEGSGYYLLVPTPSSALASGTAPGTTTRSGPCTRCSLLRAAPRGHGGTRSS